MLAVPTCPGTREGHCSMQTSLPVKGRDKGLRKAADSSRPVAVRAKPPLAFRVECVGLFGGNKIFVC